MAICSFAYSKLKWFAIKQRLYCDFNMRNFWLFPLQEEITFATYQYVINIYNREFSR